MKRARLCLAALAATRVLLGCAPVAHASERGIVSESQQRAEQSARRALAHGVPEVAVTRLQSALANTTDPAQRNEARLLLAEALVAANKPEKALEILSSAAAPRGPAADFLKAQALALLGDLAQAEPAYAAAAEVPSFDRQGEAALGRAACLYRLGRTTEAIAVLEPLTGHPRLGSEAKLRLAELQLMAGAYGAAAAALEGLMPVTLVQKKALRFLEAQVALATGEAERALRLFEDVAASPQGATPMIWVGAAVGQARALLKLRRVREAGDVLEAFIRNNPDAAELPAAFAELDMVYAVDPAASPAELITWSRDTVDSRRLLAEYYLARFEARMGRKRQAAEKLTELRAMPLPVALQRNVLAELGALLLATNRPGKAIAAFQAAALLDSSPDFRAWTEFMLGRCAHELERFKVAVEHFDRAAENPSLAAAALYNSALSCVESGDFDLFLERYAAFSARFPESDLRRDLLIEQGRFQARTSNPQAPQTLETFARDFSDHPRAGEAIFCLAEWHFQQNPPAVKEAREALLRAKQMGLAPEIESRAALLEVWLDEMSGVSHEELIRRTRRLVSTAASREVALEARIKMGDLLFRIGDYTQARLEFEKIAAESEERRPLALMLAGRSAVRSMDEAALEDAIALFEEVARSENDELATLARREQAEVHNLMRRHDEAVLLYEDILRTEQEPRARIYALLGKGRSLFAGGDTNPGHYREAIATFERVLAEPEAAPSEKNEARYMRARAFEQLGNLEAALEAYYSAIEPKDEATSDESQETDAEYFWSYKAGFDAARLLESQKRWSSALRVYETLSALDGPRSEEAKARSDQLRLEHFLWETE